MNKESPRVAEFGLGSGAPSLAPSVSVIVMAYNERASLPEVVLGLRAELQCSGRRHEIIVIDDGSTDGTREVAARLCRETPELRVVTHRTNRGLGGVYRTGFDEARGDLLSFFPADGQFPAENVSALLAAADAADLVLGYVPSTDSRLGFFLGRAERVLYCALFGRLPRFQGIFMARTARIRSLPLVSEGRGWAIVMELIIRATRAGWPISSLETSIRPRVHGSSKVRNLRSILANLRQLAKLRFRL